MEEEPKKEVNTYLRFTALAVQMGAVIGVFSWLGVFLDKKYNHGGQAWTVTLALLGVAGGMYIVLKEFIGKNSDK